MKLTIAYPALALVVAAVGCSSQAPNGYCSYGACDADGGAPGDAKADGSVSCDPATDPTCVDEKHGLFVDVAKGADGGEGTRAAPLKTIPAALGKLGAKTRIYVCDGAYPGTLAIKTSVAIYGGFACADWKAGGGKTTIMGETDYGVDISAANVTISDVEIQAPASSAQSVNSIAVRVVGVDGVVFRRAKLVAKDGHEGATGTLTSFTTFPTQADLDGMPGGALGGDKPAVNCPGGKTTKGGKGGDSGFAGMDGTPTGIGGTGGMLASCALGGTGLDGKVGGVGGAGSPAITLGVMKESRWTPAPGGAGEVGSPGGGGGGGAGLGGGGGGQGGAGGCGGAGGGGGGGGGGSVALLSVNASVSLSTVVLISARAGDGGPGVAGQAGQTMVGLRGGSAVACNGGSGASGGGGGGGAGGAGGLSAGIVYVGAAPSTTETTTNKGTGGGAGKGAASNDGIAGDAKDVYEAK